MNTLKFGIVLTAGLLCMNPASAQQATEVYIPIGESPGVSATKSVNGKITSVDYMTRSLKMSTSAGSRTVRMDDDSLYYLDRSKRREKNTMGSLEDCKVGRAVEVKLNADGQVEWIKIANN